MSALLVALSLAFLLWMILGWQMQPFVALLLASLGLGLIAGVPPLDVVSEIKRGAGDILREVMIILALGAMLGRMLEASGGAETIADTLLRWFGIRRAPIALLFASYFVGIPVMWNVAFLVLIPIVWRLQKQTGESLLCYLLPSTFALSVTHSLVPPHPGIVGAVNALAGPKTSQVIVETMLFGSLLSLALALFGWLVPGRWWANRHHIVAPPKLSETALDPSPTTPRAGFGVSMLVIATPLLLSSLGFIVDLLIGAGWLEPAAASSTTTLGPARLFEHGLVDWLRFLGEPNMAMLFATGAAFWLLGGRQGFDRKRLHQIAEKAIGDVGPMIFLFGAAGGFKQIIARTGAGDAIAEKVASLGLSPLVAAFVIAALVRVALGSATASILAASAILAKLSTGQETFMVLAVACGVTVMTQPADSGFWMMKEYGNLTYRDVLFRLNACRTLMALVGLGILVIAQKLFGIAT
jgi:Gnt-I system low-affinity gluconate transporter